MQAPILSGRWCGEFAMSGCGEGFADLDTPIPPNLVCVPPDKTPDKEPPPDSARIVRGD